MRTHIDSHGIIWVWPDPHQAAMVDAIARAKKTPHIAQDLFHIHDELVIQCPEQDLDPRTLNLALEEWLAEHGKDLQMPVDVEWGANWEKVGKSLDSRGGYDRVEERQG
ncbi:MAG: hypothetical protein E6R03_08435 [Hyphomicrobiaceae bacterium]|nr:MAG: hypothetical protein E6R03_08435 [Hyphomicrobiaceae bacterium]